MAGAKKHLATVKILSNHCTANLPSWCPSHWDNAPAKCGTWKGSAVSQSLSDKPSTFIGTQAQMLPYPMLSRCCIRTNAGQYPPSVMRDHELWIPVNFRQELWFGKVDSRSAPCHGALNMGLSEQAVDLGRFNATGTLNIFLMCCSGVIDGPGDLIF